MILCDYCEQPIAQGEEIATINGFLPPTGTVRTDEITAQSVNLQLQLHAKRNASGRSCAHDWFAKAPAIKGKKPSDT